MDELLKKAFDYASSYLNQGSVANYIPELARADKNHLACVLVDDNKNIYKIGDYQVKFSIQSIVKVVLYLCVLETYPFEIIKEYVSVKPSAKPFNSIMELELSNKRIPVNPFINAGAIVCTHLLYRKYKEECFSVVIEKLKLLTGNNDLNYSNDIFNSEKNTAYANRALTYLLLNDGIIEDNGFIEETLDVYFKSCSILVDTLDLAKMSFVFSNNGIDLNENEIISPKHARILRTLMATCGTYDYSGDFAIRIGLPAKSGVGGGIMATTHKGYGIATFSPGLDSHGNSYSGTRMLELISKELDLNIY